jgi:peptidoglycan/xylan/chitin deacetylase (PgdA/CDA1 family)
MEWFNGAKCVVCLTFDFDADISWRNILRRHKIERNNPVVLSQGQYGAKAGVPRILKLLKRLDLNAGFFITGEVVEKYPEVTREIYSNGHEIGHHGYSHRNPASCTLSEEREELEKGFKAIEEVINTKPIGYRAPAADMSENTFNLLSEYGISYDSSMMGDDLPHLIKTDNGEVIELPIRWILDDWVYFGFNYFPPLEYQSGISSHRKVYEIWLDEFEAIYEEGLYYMLVMHPQIMGVPSRTKMLEKLILEMSSKKDVWFAIPSEITQYWQEKKRWDA